MSFDVLKTSVRPEQHPQPIYLLRWVNNIDLCFLQVSYMDKTGNTDDIHRYLSTLVSIASSNPQVKAWAQKYSAGKP